MKKMIILLSIFGLCFFPGFTQNLNIGVNLGGLHDYGTELPFVNLMHNARVWYTKDANNPSGPWNSEQIAKIALRPDGYPTSIPQTVPGTRFPQQVATIWAITDGWPAGTYTVLWDGTGAIRIQGIQGTPPVAGNSQANGRLQFALPNPLGNQVEMIITRSEERDPVRNIRVIMPGHEQTYQQEPFNPRWIERVRPFSMVRFMDWGATNNWGQPDPWTWDDTRLFTWAERATLDHYTWATEKGIPYEMMIRLMNDYDLDGWVTIPHRASPEYIRSMAELFHRTLEPGRVLTVEYSNELWNWMFGQAQWLNTFGDQSQVWPERIVPSIQRALDIFSEVFGDNSPRLRRVVGVQTAWLDVSQRIVFNMRPGSFDAVAPSWYFGLSEEADAELDRLGNRATPRDIDRLVRRSWETNEKQWIQDVYYEIAQPLGLPLTFYEGGQHLTPTPFGEEPTYARALVDIQRDPLMLGLYRDWFAFLKTFVPRGQEEEFSFLHFSLVGARSAQYGSWGMLETLDQDLSRVPAPKWQAILEQVGTR